MLHNISGIHSHTYVSCSSRKLSRVFVVFQILSQCVNHSNQIFGIICSKIVYYKSLKECSLSSLIWGQMPRVCSDNSLCLFTQRAGTAEAVSGTLCRPAYTVEVEKGPDQRPLDIFFPALPCQHLPCKTKQLCLFLCLPVHPTLYETLTKPPCPVPLPKCLERNRQSGALCP